MAAASWGDLNCNGKMWTKKLQMQEESEILAWAILSMDGKTKWEAHHKNDYRRNGEGM